MHGAAHTRVNLSQVLLVLARQRSRCRDLHSARGLVKDDKLEGGSGRTGSALKHWRPLRD